MSDPVKPEQRDLPTADLFSFDGTREGWRHRRALEVARLAAVIITSDDVRDAEDAVAIARSILEEALRTEP